MVSIVSLLLPPVWNQNLSVPPAGPDGIGAGADLAFGQLPIGDGSGRGLTAEPAELELKGLDGAQPAYRLASAARVAALALVTAVWVALHTYELVWWREARAESRSALASS